MKYKSSLFLLITKISACFFIVRTRFFLPFSVFSTIFTERLMPFPLKPSNKEAMAHPSIPTDMPSQMVGTCTAINTRCLRATRIHWAGRRECL